MFGIIKKYKLWYPWQMLRVIYYNFMRINRVGKSYLIPAPQAVFDIHKTASITLKNNLIFGWCNMKSSKMETALCMGKNSQLECGGGKSGCLNMVGYGSYLQVGNGAKLKIGDSFINREVKIICNKSITIGDDCIIAMGTVIRDNDGGNHQKFAPGYENAKPIIIGNHVWLGENVMILKGVTIGEGAIVAASSLVLKDVPPHTLVAGSPAKVIKDNVSWKA